MALSNDARRRLVVATTSKKVGSEIADTVDALGVQATSAPFSLYVDPTGSDANTGLTPLVPLATFQSALDRISSLRIRDLVSIVAAPGNYSGFLVPAFNIVPRNDGSVAGVLVRGSTVTATLGQGLATGTLTSVTAGTASTATFTIWTDSTQNWTVNALKGMFVEILTGTGAGVIFPIESNSATALTIHTTAATAAASSTYAIREAGAVITTPILSAPQIPAVGGAFGATSPAAIIVNGPVNANPATATVRLELIKVALTSQTSTSQGVIVQNPNGGVTLARMQIDHSTAGSPLLIRGSGQCTITQSVVTVNTLTGITMQAADALRLALTNTLVRALGSGSTAINAGTTLGSSISLGSSIRLEGSSGIVFLTSGWIEISGATKIMNAAAGTASTGIRCRFNGASAGGGLTTFLFPNTGLIIDGRQSSTAVAAEGPVNYRFDGNLIVTNALNGISLIEGARVRLSSGSTMTTVTNELVVDSVNQTLVTLRSGSPKVLPTSVSLYGTVIYE